MIDGPTIVDDFLPAVQCRLLTHVLDQELDESHTGNASPDFDGRTVNLGRLQHETAREILYFVRRRAVDIAESVYRTGRLYPDYTDLVKWPTGSELGEHIDNEPGRFDAHRTVSGVVYLTDNHMGGETIVGEATSPTVRVIQPYPGTLALWPAHVPHRVTRITHGTRYTLALWLTDDPTQEEELR